MKSHLVKGTIKILVCLYHGASVPISRTISVEGFSGVTKCVPIKSVHVTNIIVEPLNNLWRSVQGYSCGRVTPSLEKATFVMHMSVVICLKSKCLKRLDAQPYFSIIIHIIAKYG